MPQLAVPVAAEAAVASTMTAAEIAAAEAAAQAAAEAAAAEAATQAAAQAAAEQAAQQAAQQAAAQAASEAAAQQAAQQAAAQAAQNSGIPTLANEVGAIGQPTGIEQIFQQTQVNPMTQSEFLNNPLASNQLPPGFKPVASGAESINPTLDPLTNAPYIPAPTVAPPIETPPFDVQGFEGLDASQVSQTSPTAPTAPIQDGGMQMRDAATPYEWTKQTTAPNAGAATEPSGISKLFDKALAYAEKNPLQTGFGLMSAYNMLNKPKPYEKPKYKSTFNAGAYRGYEPTPPAPYQPQYPQYAGGGPIEAMSNANALGENTGYPMAGINKGAYATPYQTPISRNVITGSSDTGVNPMTGEMTNFAAGGISDLGAFSDGGRMLKGPGDGMSDDIPATIANKQPARLANEEFVIPADVVSHLGNGSSEAGAKQLYKMMDRVRQARTGTKKQGKQIKPEKYLA